MEHKRGLVLSGGAAFGAFQIGVLEAAEEMGYTKWDLIAGASVGALNGSMIALDKFEKLVDIWKTSQTIRYIPVACCQPLASKKRKGLSLATF